MKYFEIKNYGIGYENNIEYSSDTTKVYYTIIGINI